MNDAEVLEIIMNSITGRKQYVRRLLRDKFDVGAKGKNYELDKIKKHALRENKNGLKV